MNKKKNKPVENDDLLKSAISESDDFPDFEEDENGGSSCGLVDLVLSILSIPKPLDICWEDENIERLLVARGYKIMNRHVDETGEDIRVAIKPGDTLIPDKQSDILKTFEKEVQAILIDWLIKIGTNGK